MIVETITFRQATTEDHPFLERACYLAGYSINGQIPEGSPTFDEAKTIGSLAGYTEGWGREGDFGLIAHTNDGEDIGAAWYRHFQAAPTGAWLGLAIIEDHQQRGVGKQLLRALLLAANQNGVQEIGLTVKPTNSIAKRLYLDLGFTVTGISLGRDVMLASTMEPTNLK